LTIFSWWFVWVTASNSTQVPTPTPTPTSSVDIGDECASLAQCQLVSTASSICPTDDFGQCFCPPVVTAGPACSQCWLALNTTKAVILGDDITSCVSLFPSLTPGPTLTKTTSQTVPPLVSGPCATQCSLILEEAPVCGNNISCFCPAYIQQGMQCSSCMVTVLGLPAVGATVSQVWSNCQVFGFTSSDVNATQTPTTRAGSVTFNDVPTTASTSSVKSGAGHGRKMSFGVEFLCLVGTMVGFFAGLTS
jgi:hypothetical protein